MTTIMHLQTINLILILIYYFEDGSSPAMSPPSLVKSNLQHLAFLGTDLQAQLFGTLVRLIWICPYPKIMNCGEGSGLFDVICERKVQEISFLVICKRAFKSDCISVLKLNSNYNCLCLHNKSYFMFCLLNKFWRNKTYVE